MSETRNNGALFRVKAKKHEKYPDWRGHIEISDDLLNHLIELRRTGQKAEMELAGWQRTSPNSGPYLSLLPGVKRPKQNGNGASTTQPADSGEGFSW